MAGDPVLVVAAGGDRDARRLVAAWPGGDARLLTPATLRGFNSHWSMDAHGRVAYGWHLAPDAFDGQAPSTKAWLDEPGGGRIRGVVSLLDTVRAVDLPHVAPADREYVASEMTAYLCAWLHALECPKFNAPSLGSLCGDVHPFVWRAFALDCGLRIVADAVRGPAGSEIAVTAIGSRVLGTTDCDLIAMVRALAAACGVHMLTVRLGWSGGGWAFRSASAVPSVGDPLVAAAVVETFEDRAA